MLTTAQDVIDLFAGSEEATRAFASWRDDPRRSGVHQVVLGHEVRHTYRVTAQHVTDLNHRIHEDSDERRHRSWGPRDPFALHPLGAIRSRDVAPERSTATRAIADWSPPLAFNHAFHYLLEAREGRLFTFLEFRRASTQESVLERLLTSSARQLHSRLRAEGHADDLLHSCFRWRLGCAYYSFLRELFVLGVLRDQDRKVQVHPLADTLFRTDFWRPGVSIELLIVNERYKSKALGRKAPMERFARDVFRIRRRIELQQPAVFGRAHLPDRRDLRFTL